MNDMLHVGKDTIVHFDDDTETYSNGSWGQRLLERTLKKKLYNDAIQVRSATSVLEWEHMFTASGKPRLYLCDHDISTLVGNEKGIFQFIDPILFAIKNNIYAIVYSGSGEDIIRDDIAKLIDTLRAGALYDGTVKHIPNNDIWHQKGEKQFFQSNTGFYSARELMALERTPVVEKGDTEHLLFHVQKSAREKLRFIL